MAKRGEIELEDLDPMSDEVAAANGVEIRVHREPDGTRSSVIVPRSVARLDPRQAGMVSDLQRHALLLQQVRGLIEANVLDARDLGVSWAVIGWTLGTTESAARKRWGDS
jgi:hypothetical protein